MLPDKVKAYLTLTRGEGSFFESCDDDIAEFKKRYNTTLVDSSIEVVVIKSYLAKTEIIELDEMNYLIWDCTFFDNFTFYASNIFDIKNIVAEHKDLSYLEQKQLCKPSMMDMWNKLYGHQIQCLVNSGRIQKKMIINDCLESDDNHSTIINIRTNQQNIYSTLYYSKYYIFCHELAHITYKKDIEFLDTVFNIAQSVLKSSSIKSDNFNLIEASVEALVNSDNYSSSPFYQEILADTRAVQTTWSGIIFDLLGETKSVFTDKEMVCIFPHILKAQDGIDLVRSFLLRSSNLRYLVNSLLLEDTDAGVFIDFLIRDCFSNPVNLALLCGFDNNTGRGKYYLTLFDKYRCERNIPIINRLFEDEFNNHFSTLTKIIEKKKQ